MTKLTVIADIYAEKDQIERVKQALIGLIEPTKQEAGCLDYELHQDNQAPSHFIFYENWASFEAWQDHMQSEHIRQFGEKTQGLIESANIHQMTHLE
ncbi:putative quinol monooxygenase [Gayadomonas joobiniege]|uniref:putative quinol monooxygenase n=1 Tax=Gayadomonas joobiniege TaxID=1234606 RepID=UPI00035E109F|nr:putative quinol monooxygenase [Gayadomonas joobiniege]